MRNDGKITNDEMRKIWEKAVVLYVKLLSDQMSDYSLFA
jgi:hypothetical protein